MKIRLTRATGTYGKRAAQVGDMFTVTGVRKMSYVVKDPVTGRERFVRKQDCEIVREGPMNKTYTFVVTDPGDILAPDTERRVLEILADGKEYTAQQIWNALGYVTENELTRMDGQGIIVGNFRGGHVFYSLPPAPETFQVRVIGASSLLFWYARRIGEVFTVRDSGSDLGYTVIGKGGTRWIRRHDCARVDSEDATTDLYVERLLLAIDALDHEITDGSTYGSRRERLEAARWALADILRDDIARTPSPQLLHHIESVRGKIARIRRARLLLDISLKEAKELTEKYFEHDGAGKLKENG